jgi:hypothetical protein
MTRKIISIKRQNTNNLQVTLQLTTACPYACSYCPEFLHTGTNLDFNLDNLKIFFTRFSNRQILLTVTGGECTTHPQFIDVLTLARNLKIKTIVDTNSVRTARFYSEVAGLADVWNVTLHPSQHKFDLEKIRVLTDHSFVVVYIMMDPRHWDVAIDWWRQTETLNNIKVIPLQTISNWAGANFESMYTPEQTTWLKTTASRMQLTLAHWEILKPTHSWLITTESDVIFDNGDIEELDGYMFVKENLNQFYNWQCMAGNETVAINANGSAVWANCGIKRYDSLLDITPEELLIPMTCNRLSCECITDIRASKINYAR